MPILLLLLLLCSFPTFAQKPDSLNTARTCQYMKPEEQEMIYEINCLRSNPRSYLQYIEPMLKSAKANLQKSGKGERNYSVTITTSTFDGKTTQRFDTTWHYTYEEEVRALTILVSDLKRIKRLSILQPDSGIYKAAQKHATDQRKHDWKLLHTGSDGSSPWQRITQFSPTMHFGNENIAGSSGNATPRSMVIQLLVDAGIPGYGHRYNLLDPQWTHVACVWEFYKGYMNWWIQNFGARRK